MRQHRYVGAERFFIVLINFCYEKTIITSYYILGGGDESKAAPVRYRVEGGTMFNSIVRLCVVGFHPALKTILKQVRTEVYYVLVPRKGRNHVRLYVVGCFIRPSRPFSNR